MEKSTFSFSFEKKESKKIGCGGDFFPKEDKDSVGRVDVPSPQIVITFPGFVRRFTAKKNHIGLMVSEILSYTHTNRHLVTFIKGLDSLK